MYKIGILFQNRDFEHDVYELIKAFYPGNEIVSLYEEDDADYDIRFRVSRDEEGYTISYNNGIEKKTAHGAVIEGQSSGEASDALISCNDAHDIRRKNKDAIKYALYQMLSKTTGKTLPWGNLTGIRPVKMAMGMLESGMKNTEIAFVLSLWAMFLKNSVQDAMLRIHHRLVYARLLVKKALVQMLVES